MDEGVAAVVLLGVVARSGDCDWRWEGAAPPKADIRVLPPTARGGVLATWLLCDQAPDDRGSLADRVGMAGRAPAAVLPPNLGVGPGCGTNDNGFLMGLGLRLEGGGAKDRGAAPNLEVVPPPCACNLGPGGRGIDGRTGDGFIR